MHGLMSERPLLVSAIIAHAAIYHHDTEFVSRTVEGAIQRYTYAEAERRSKRLARALSGRDSSDCDVSAFKARLAPTIWNAVLEG